MPHPTPKTEPRTTWAAMFGRLIGVSLGLVRAWRSLLRRVPRRVLLQRARAVVAGQGMGSEPPAEPVRFVGGPFDGAVCTWPEAAQREVVFGIGCDAAGLTCTAAGVERFARYRLTAIGRARFVAIQTRQEVAAHV